MYINTNFLFKKKIKDTHIPKNQRNFENYIKDNILNGLLYVNLK